MLLCLRRALLNTTPYESTNAGLPAPACAPASTKRSRLAPVAGVAMLAGASSPCLAFSDPHPGWTQSGNVLQFALPLAALGMSLWLPPDPDTSTGVALFADGPAGSSPGLNWPGPRLGRTAPQDVAIALARTEIVTYALKYSIDARRPNGGSHGFPSGHSSAAFMGAEYIRKTHGLAWGLPAYATATWVGYTRVESHNHYWRDVIAGAAIGIASNHDLDHVQTAAGEFRFAPALLLAGVSSPDEDDAPALLDTANPARPVPGVQFELRFW